MIQLLDVLADWDECPPPPPDAKLILIRCHSLEIIGTFPSCFLELIFGKTGPYGCSAWASRIYTLRCAIAGILHRLWLTDLTNPRTLQTVRDRQSCCVHHLEHLGFCAAVTGPSPVGMCLHDISHIPTPCTLASCWEASPGPHFPVAIHCDCSQRLDLDAVRWMRRASKTLRLLTDNPWAPAMSVMSGCKSARRDWPASSPSRGAFCVQRLFNRTATTTPFAVVRTLFMTCSLVIDANVNFHVPKHVLDKLPDNSTIRWAQPPATVYERRTYKSRRPSPSSNANIWMSGMQLVVGNLR